MTLINNALFIASGIAATVPMTLTALVLGFTGGLVVAVLRHEGYGKLCTDPVISLLRGTPLLLQISFFYFAVPGLLGIKLTPWIAGVLTLGLNSMAYVAEAIRGGIASVPKGQFEAARSLRVAPLRMWVDIIMPQALRAALPSLVNEAITLLKETSLVSVLGVMDIMRCAQVISAQQYSYFMPLCIAGIYYYVLVLIITMLGKKLEQKVGLC